MADGAARRSEEAGISHPVDRGNSRLACRKVATQQVSANITDVQRGASETGSVSSHVLAAAQSLSNDSKRLKLEVGKFLNTVRAA